VVIPPPRLLDDLRGLVNNPELSDVTFVVEGQQVHACRILLAARSEHFRAMLYGEKRALPPSLHSISKFTDTLNFSDSTRMGNVVELATFTLNPLLSHVLAAGGMRESYMVGGGKANGVEGTCGGVEGIEIEDMAHEVFLKVVEFLYTDEVAETPAELAVPLLIAAERFLLPRLKGLCEDAIRKGIATTNVVHTLLAAHRHHAAALKDMCLDFVLEHLDSVKGTPAFAELKTEPDLLMEIILRGA
jgi:hypothetical protein